MTLTIQAGQHGGRKQPKQKGQCTTTDRRKREKKGGESKGQEGVSGVIDWKVKMTERLKKNQCPLKEQLRKINKMGGGKWWGEEGKVRFLVKDEEDFEKLPNLRKLGKREKLLE